VGGLFTLIDKNNARKYAQEEQGQNYPEWFFQRHGKTGHVMPDENANSGRYGCHQEDVKNGIPERQLNGGLLAHEEPQCGAHNKGYGEKGDKAVQDRDGNRQRNIAGKKKIYQVGSGSAWACRNKDEPHLVNRIEGKDKVNAKSNQGQEYHLATQSDQYSFRIEENIPEIPELYG